MCFIVVVVLDIVLSLPVALMFSGTGQDGEFVDRYDCLGYGSDDDG